MAQLLAPYHNGMRLGQGFNSYTQQICLDNAVLLNTAENRTKVSRYYIPDPDDDDKGLPSLSEAEKTIRKEIELLKQATDESTEVSVGHDEEQSTALKQKAEGEAGGGRPPWTKPQIVTYSSRFVDKLSDVTDSMNISGALSIQTATVGGKGSGSYVDSDKFKESDINFHLQVKVVNQIHKFDEYSLFNKIHTVRDADFPAVYGDTFISGWEEGGEFNAIISMKVTDKSKTFEVKASLEATLSLSGMKGGDLKVQFEMVKNNISKNTETTIAVNWSGGGSIKDPEEAWTMESMKKAAAAFPDLVAITPQRTYAILTKYIALESFQRQRANYSQLDYENAGIYTAALLDHYMDYKMMWKQLSQATYELEANRAKIDWAQLDEETSLLARINPLPDDDIGKKLSQSEGSAQDVAEDRTKVKDKLTGTGGEQGAQPGAHDSDNNGSDVGGKGVMISSNKPVVGTPQPAPKTASKTSALSLQAVEGTVVLDVKDAVTGTVRKVIQVKPFKPSFPGLIAARKICRIEMAKIVNEVDLVTRKPLTAQETIRDSYFLHPLIFKMLLPVVRAWSEDMLANEGQVNAPIILGYSAPPDRSKALPDVCLLDDSIKRTPDSFNESLAKVRRKAKDYRMRGLVATLNGQDGSLSLPSGVSLFNDLETLDPTYRPSVLSVWQGEGTYVLGIQIRFANGELRSYGICDDAVPRHSLVLASDGSEMIFEMKVNGKKDTKTNQVFVGSIQVVTTLFNTLDTTKKPNTTPPPPPEAPKDSANAPQAGSTQAPTASQSTQSASDAAKARTLVDNGSFTFLKPDDTSNVWSIRGFFGYQDDTKTINAFGVVWGKDSFIPIPGAKQVPALCRAYYSMDSGLQNDVAWLRSQRPEYSGNFVMGNALKIDTGVSTTYFNLLDVMYLDWKLKKLGFANKDGRLVGMNVEWTNGRLKTIGLWKDIPESGRWWVDVSTDLVALKMVSGMLDKTKKETARIQTVECIRAGSDGNLPDWLLDLSTLRYLGNGDLDKLVEKGTVVERAPVTEGPKWSIRGFYGWKEGDANKEGALTGLGPIWGRA